MASSSTRNGDLLLEGPVRLYRDPYSGRVWAFRAYANPEWCWMPASWVPEGDSAAFLIGVVVVAHSLLSANGAKLNGLLGTVVGFQGDRVCVQFPDCGEKALKPVNLGVTWSEIWRNGKLGGVGRQIVPKPKTPQCRIQNPWGPTPEEYAASQQVLPFNPEVSTTPAPASERTSE